MIRIKFLGSCYDEHSGVSIVRVATRHGVYEGVAREHPKEKAKSRIFGCMMAENRADIKALKEAVRFKKAELKGAERVYAECQTKQARGVVKGIKKEIAELEGYIKEEELELKKIKKVREKTLRELEEVEQNKKQAQAFNVLSSEKRNLKI